ncbi:acyltransferase domain-containing protein [Wenjunlia tyrosinilytica]|uniref:Polyketide synthase n=1 Tax=Wenjunlia tyrosinilytica TaxID=1544741 RepID=A0A917ZU50_9ACTN|nr:acyltransferase domain-containing protein [Wenjunlia tyrosinilytica]GGO95468.1 hypothetical protein GCM10012280_52730 [Wenjunlia tyrosinilytica]
MRTVGSANRAGLRLAPAADVQQAGTFPRSGLSGVSAGAAGGIAVVGVDRFPWGSSDQDPAPRPFGAGGAEAFDCDFFSLSPRDAGQLDPRQRVLLQCAWRALEDAAIAPRRRSIAGTGVFVEATEGLAAAGDWAAAEAGLGAVAQWISYQLGLNGPSLDVRTDGEAAPVALLLACDVLAGRECDLALVAGARLSELRTADGGRSRQAPGAAVLALCRLDDALADRRPVYAVLRDSTDDPSDEPCGGVVDVADSALALYGGGPWRLPAGSLAPLDLQEPPSPLPPPTTDAGMGVFTFSADTAQALSRNLAEHAEAIGEAIGEAAGQAGVTGSRARTARLCWTSNEVKTDLPYRFALAAGDLAELADGLRRAALDPAVEASLSGVPEQSPAVAYVLPGEGSEYPGMTARLYRGAPLYRRALDEADEALRPYFEHRVRDLLLRHDTRVHRPSFAQPALFAVEYALGRALSELGVEPGMLVGYGCGEFAAACLAGVLDVETAARLVSVRGRLVEELPPGGLLEVFTTLEETAGLIRDEPEVYLAAVEGPCRVVLSAAPEVLARVGERMRLQGVHTRARAVEHAYHSPLMAPIMREWRRALEGAAFAPALIPVVSTVRGRLLGRDRMDTDYWLQHAIAPVRFAEAAEALLAERPTHVLELGPGSRLAQHIREIPSARGVGVRPVCSDSEAADGGLAELAAALYRDGHNLSWEALYPLEHRAFARLRPYRFSAERQFGPGTGADGTAGALPDEAVPRGTATGDSFVAAVVDAVARVCDCLPGEVTTDARLYDDLGFDSVMYMDLVGELERRIPQVGSLVLQEMMPSLESVEALAGYLRHVAGRVAA